ncbi:MAG: hypothetical protein MUF49_24815 [Oculatellaceae cyanobacterium Prado106]|jgi:hypothetical protein|nr:hypothetical protein [Oculatellaceae cyanobacterium Prado106]
MHNRYQSWYSVGISSVTAISVGFAIATANLLIQSEPAIFQEKSYANAAPDPLFTSVLEEIRRELPDGWSMRLPAAVPSTEELYPYVRSANNRLTVNLSISPDCPTSQNPASCTIGILGVSGVSEDFPPTGDNLSLVDLGNRVQGYHFTRGDGDEMNRLVVWQQDGLIYGAVTMANVLSQEELMAIASSMATEPPITSEE